MKHRTFAAAAGGLLLIAMATAQAVELPRIFADGMVLQRDQPIPVWGQSAPAAQVRLHFDGQTASGVADAAGRWHVELPAHAAGGPYQLRIDDGKDVRVLRDVLVGEVWLASGQSNMEMPLSQTEAAAAAVAAARDPLVRHFKIPKSWAGTPQWQLQGGSWVAASPATAGDFSAAAYYFAQALRKRTGVAVGIIDSTWGGSRIEAWTDVATQAMSADEVARQAEALRASDVRKLAATRRNLARWPQLPATAIDDRGWQAADLDSRDWAALKVPGLWETQGWDGMDGIAWYRASFSLSAAEASAGVRLGVGRIDDSDVTYVNGVEVGQTRVQYNLPRVYAVPASALRAGRNSIAIRVIDTGGGGGIHGEPGEVFVQPAGGNRRPLPAVWAFRPAAINVALVDDKNQFPALLYNAMIHPLQDYALRGVLWYQGEANAGSVEDALRYRSQFPALIRQWRAQFGQPALPFLWVQLAPFGSGGDRRDEAGVVTASPWALLRESQSAALALPATAQAVITDAGDSLDIHPRNKRVVGERLALAAAHVAYGDDDLACSGPTFARAEPRGDALVLQFDHAQALAARGGLPLRGFELAGGDGRFHPAQAQIEGRSVVLRSAAVPRPTAARYGWSEDPQAANLIGDGGLPASPFRTAEAAR